MTPHQHLLRVAALAMLAPSALAAAQDAAPPPTGGDGLLPDTEITVTAGAWVPRLGGHTRLGDAPGARTISVENEFDLDSSEATFNLEVRLRRHETWELFLGGFDFSADDDGRFPRFASFGGLDLAPGDPYRASFDISSFNTEMTVHAWRIHGEQPGSSDAGDTDFRFTLAVGARYVQVDQSVTQVGVGREKGQGRWLFPYAALGLGLRYPDEDDAIPFLHQFEVDGSFGLGPSMQGGGGYMWQIRAGATWLFTPNVGATFGYRLVEIDADDDDFDVQAGLQGLFLAATIRF